MKFGKKILELSIPEWKKHCLDYNSLKSSIKLAVKDEISLVELKHQFIDNFDTIDLFIKTKYNECCKTFHHYSNQLDVVLEDGEMNGHMKLVKLDILVSKLIELSIVLRKLSKFILLQKIAVKKIFKKFNKKFDDENGSSKFILTLKLYLNKDKHSFVNFNLISLTIKLTNLINLIRFESNKLNNVEEPPSSGLIGSTLDSNTSPIESNTQFDFLIYLKKNFKLSFLLPDDSNNFNEVLVKLNIYLDFKNLNPQSSVNSVIYLQNDKSLTNQPSFILSEMGSDTSLLIIHIGGLRKFSYCYLPNQVIDCLIGFVKDGTDSQIESTLIDHFSNTSVDSLTKLTVDSMIGNKLTPKGKIYYRSLRYYSNKSQPDPQDPNFVPINENYLLALNSKIYSTSSSQHINTTAFNLGDTDSLDTFPFNTVELFSNDPNLLNFEKNLLTEIKDDHLLINKFSNNLLNKLPTKIQKLVKNDNSINLVKNFDIYQYLLSCYHNVIPEDLNNHFSCILKLNLFKNFESIEKFNNDLNFDMDMMKDNSDKILKNQLSLKDLVQQDVVRKEQEKQQKQDQKRFKQKQTYRPGLNKNNSIQSSSSFSLSIFTNSDKKYNDEFDELIENEDNESLKLFWNEDFENKSKFTRSSRSGSMSHLSPFVVNLLNLKSKLQRSETSDSLDQHHDYNSINETTTDYYEALDNYFYEHDKILSFFYLMLSATSVFISSVELGILCSILKLQQSNKFTLFDNPWLLLVLIMGIIIAGICSTLSFNLILKRYSGVNMTHFFIVGLSFTLILVSGISCSVLLFI